MLAQLTDPVLENDLIKLTQITSKLQHLIQAIKYYLIVKTDVTSELMHEKKSFVKCTKMK